VVKDALRLSGACALALLAAVTVFLGLQATVLVLTSDTQIIGNLIRSHERGTLSAAGYPAMPYGQQVDTWTECVALGINLGNSEQPLLRRLAAMPFLGLSPDASPCATLVTALIEDKVHADKPYFRYWHGHQVYLRPLLSVTGLASINRLNAALLLGAITLLCVRLSAWFGFPAGLAFAWVWHTDILSVPATTTHSLSLAWIFLSVAIVGRALERDGQRRANLLLVFLCGSVASYFDIMFNPALAPALIGFLAMSLALMREPDLPNAPRNALMYGGLCVVFWFAGFGLAWAAKWVFAALVLGVNEVVSDVRGAIALRAGLDANTHVNMLTATLASFSPYRRAVPF
jgi:hypothetical protein